MGLNSVAGFNNEHFVLLGCQINQWYLIQLKPNSHSLAERNLRRQGFETFLPMQKITHRKASRFVSDLKPAFLGYMCVSVNSKLALGAQSTARLGSQSL